MPTHWSTNCTSNVCSFELYCSCIYYVLCNRRTQVLLRLPSSKPRAGRSKARDVHFLDRDGRACVAKSRIVFGEISANYIGKRVASKQGQRNDTRPATADRDAAIPRTQTEQRQRVEKHTYPTAHNTASPLAIAYSSQHTSNKEK